MRKYNKNVYEVSSDVNDFIEIDTGNGIVYEFEVWGECIFEVEPYYDEDWRKPFVDYSISRTSVLDYRLNDIYDSRDSIYSNEELDEISENLTAKDVKKLDKAFEDYCYENKEIIYSSVENYDFDS